MRWKIWYGDGSTFSDEDGTPEQAPRGDVQVIAEVRDSGERGLRAGTDYYVFAHGGWDCALVPPIVKEGTTIESARYRDLRYEAQSWLDE